MRTVTRHARTGVPPPRESPEGPPAVLDRGRVAEQGTHYQLRHAGRPYQRMWECCRVRRATEQAKPSHVPAREDLPPLGEMSARLARAMLEVQG